MPMGPISLSSFLRLLLLLFSLLSLASTRPTIDEIGAMLRSGDPAIMARLEQIMGSEFSDSGRLFNLQRLG